MDEMEERGSLSPHRSVSFLKAEAVIKYMTCV